MQPFPNPSDASYKIWLQSTSRSQRYSCLKVWTHGRTDALTPARVPSYKLTLWAFGSGELKSNDKEPIQSNSTSCPRHQSCYQRGKKMASSIKLRGSAVGFRLLQRFSVGLAVEYSCCFTSVMNIDLYICLLYWFMDELEVLHADRITCMCMNHSRTQDEVARA